MKNSKKKNLSKSKKSANPSHASILPRLNRVQGQITGISEMIRQNRYCTDILMQLKASRSALKSIEAAVLKNHLEHCVADAFLNQDSKGTKTKVEEIVKLFLKEN